MANEKLICTDGGRAAASIQDRNDCTVRALAIASGIPYAAAHALLKAHGRKQGKGVLTAVVIDAFKDHLGDYVRTSPFMSERPTVASFLRDQPKGTFVVAVRGHVFAVIDGVQHDNGEGLYKPRCRVKGFWPAK